jgi:hypothetical protein
MKLCNESENRKSPPFARQREPDRAKPQAKGRCLRAVRAREVVVT